MPRIASPFGGLIGAPAPPSVPIAANPFDPTDPTASFLGPLGRRRAAQQPEMPTVTSMGQGFANLGTAAVEGMAERSRRQQLGQALMGGQPAPGASPDGSMLAGAFGGGDDEEGGAGMPAAAPRINLVAPIQAALGLPVPASPDPLPLVAADPTFPAADPGIWW